MKTLTIFILFVSSLCLAQTQINVTDSLGKKQGHWVVIGKMKPNATAYLPNQLIEEGYYKDNRKTGVWKEYYSNGNQKNELNFENGRPSGKAIMYHENGCIKEEGNWKNNRWYGTYKSYNEKEELMEQRVFDEKGKISGSRTNCITL